VKVIWTDGEFRIVRLPNEAVILERIWGHDQKDNPTWIRVTGIHDLNLDNFIWKMARELEKNNAAL